MAQLLVRGIEDGLHQWLRERSARHGRSMEAEVREILTHTRTVDVHDPISRILVAMEGSGTDPFIVDDQSEPEHATFS